MEKEKPLEDLNGVLVMKEFKVSPSQCGKIMTSSRKKGSLSKTCLTYVDEWIKSQIYGRKKYITSKAIEKGNEVEDESIEFIDKHLNLGGVSKNEKLYEDDFMIGTPDVLTKDLVIDVKNSFDCFTFPLLEKEIPNKDYFYQLQCYMALTGKKKAKLVYTLMNTPEHLCKYDMMSHDYDNIDPKYRIKVFDIERDEDVIDEIRKRVIEIRNHLEVVTAFI
jgi:hypothetical protein